MQNPESLLGYGPIKSALDIGQGKAQPTLVKGDGESTLCLDS